MSSPNGYIASETVSNTDRNWLRLNLGYDSGAAPWHPGQLGNYRFTWDVSTAGPAGPWTAAQTTGPGSQCNAGPAGGNTFPPQGVTSTQYGIGGLAADTDYWIRIRLADDTAAVVEDYVIGPYHTEAYPAFLCAPTTGVTSDSGTANLVLNSGRVNVVAPCNQDDMQWEIAPSASGPWTPAASEPVTDLTPSHTFGGLSPSTQYFYRARFSEDTPTPHEYLVTEPCSFTTAALVPPSFNPQPCCDTAGSGGPDVENQILCDLDDEGNLLGTALAVYEYDASGNLAAGSPTYLDPVTGQPYTPLGTLQVCPDSACLPPMQFCQTGTSTGPVEHPGRMYDITLPINPGFAVESMVVGQVTSPANIVWEVDDHDGEQFRAALTAFMESRLPAAAVVTITNPNAGTPQVCGTAVAMQIHVECLRLDQAPPDLIELSYNGGQDLILNPAYNENPPLNPPVAQGNYGFHLLARQDDSPPWPGNPPANRVLCTETANIGWETNDVGRTFEIWGKDVAAGVTPTPRGTPVQEITSDGPPPGRRSTIWQTFTAPASADFKIRIVHGGRDAGEEHRITLDNGDTDDQQNGTLINDVTHPAAVYGGNPWTQFNQTIPLTAGQVYTLALSTTNPQLFNRGGLFTDMRAYIDRPGLRATATTDDDTCTVTTQETTTTSTCSFWQPQCVGGTIAGWEKVDTGERMSNAEFWAQTPTPMCCGTETAPGGESSATLSNMAVSDTVCGVVGGIRQNLVRQVVLDPSGGQLLVSFLSQDGAPVEPTTWNPGACASERFVGDVILCDRTPDGRIVGSFLRKYVQTWSPESGAQVTEVRDFNLAGTGLYTLQGIATECANTATPADRDTDVTVLCDDNGGVITPFQLRQTFDGFGTLTEVSTWTMQDDPYTPTGSVGACEPDPIATTGLCLADGTPIAVVARRDSTTGAVTEDGWINLLTGAFSAGLPPAGTSSCSSGQSIQTSGVFCSVDDTTQDVLELVVIEYHYATDGSIESVRLVSATTGATYTVPAGASITVCPTGGEQSSDRDIIVLCDVNGGVATPFVRDFSRNNTGTITGHTDYTLANAPYTTTGTVGFCAPNTRIPVTEVLCDVNAGVSTPFERTTVRDVNGAIITTLDQTLGGAPYTPTGTVGVCSATTVRDPEILILCDSAATPNRFVQTRVLSDTGAVVSITNTTLAGAPFVPTGAVGVCAQTVQSDTDFVEEVLCDGTGTAFIRLFRFNSVTGALVSTTNTTLAGAAYTPSGTVGLCTSCCPVVTAEGCTNTGSGRYVAIRGANGVISLLDAVTGAAVTQAQIVPCTSDPVTLTAQHRLVADADAPWTPVSDVTGVLTSVTFSVLSGTATVTDQNGTAAAGLPAGLTVTWNAEDHDTLGGPQSIDAVGGQVYVNWTQR